MRCKLSCPRRISMRPEREPRPGCIRPDPKGPNPLRRSPAPPTHQVFRPWSSPIWTSPWTDNPDTMLGIHLTAVLTTIVAVIVFGLVIHKMRLPANERLLWLAALLALPLQPLA